MSNTQAAEQPWHETNETWRFTVEQNESGAWEASLPYRKIICEGDSRDEAVAGLLRCYCELSRDGSFNPKRVEAIGADPIQHALEVLQEELSNAVLNRGADCYWSEQEEDAEVRKKALTSPDFQRRNEVISGLGTAIAALARIKEL